MSEKSNSFDYESLPPRRLPKVIDEETFKRSSFVKNAPEQEEPLFAPKEPISERLVGNKPLNNAQPSKKTINDQSAFEWIVKSGHSVSFAGLFIFTCLVFFRPYELAPSLSWLSQSAFYVAVSTIVVFLFSQLGLENRLTARPREVILILLLLVTAALSIPKAVDPMRAWGSFVDFLKVVLIFIVMVNVLRTEKRLRTLFMLSLLAGCVLSVSAISDYWTGRLALQGLRIKGSIGGLFDNPNDLALHLVTAIPLAVALLFDSRNLFTKLFYGAVGILMVGGLIATFSRGGFLGMACAAVILFWRIAGKNKWLLGIFLPIAFAVMIVVGPAGYLSRLATTNDGSAVARTADLKRSIYVALHHPLLGIGMNNYTLYSDNGLATHNAYTQVGVELGLAAMVFYTLFLITPLRHLRRIAKETSSNRKKSLFYLAVGIEASLIGYMVSSFFGSVAYLWYAYYLVAYGVCLRRLYATRDVSKPKPTFLAI